jgi:hypothetical protein
MRAKKRARCSMLAVAAMIFGLSGWLAAQGPKGYQRPHAFGARMADQLNLSEGQQNQIKFFLDDSRKQLETLRAHGSLTRDQRREQVRQVKDSTRTNIQSILSVEQKMQATQLQQQRQDRVEERRQHKAEHMLEGLSRKLELSAAQQETIEAYQLDHFDTLRALREDSTLTRRQKKEQILALQQQIKGNIHATLTSEQQTKFDALRQKRGKGRRPVRRNRGFRPGDSVR